LKNPNILLTAAFAALASAALHAGDPAKDAPAFDGNIQKYWTDACARCHGANGSGRDATGKQLPDAGFDFTDARKANKKKDSDWIQVTLNGKDKMPAYKERLKAEDVQKMITEIIRKFAAR
jgi:mono/diheme cytochrome c family protein